MITRRPAGRFDVDAASLPSFVPRAAPHPNPLPAANPQPPAGRGDSRVAPLIRSAQLTQTESPLPAGGVGVGGGERARVRGGSRPDLCAQLEGVYIRDDARIAQILTELRRKVADIRTMRALGFCVGIEHARYMAARIAKARSGTPRPTPTTSSSPWRGAKGTTPPAPATETTPSTRPLPLGVAVPNPRRLTNRPALHPPREALQQRHAPRPSIEQGRWGRTPPFSFLGPATYVGHSGERPMPIVWRLHRAMPMDVFKVGGGWVS